MSHTYSRDKLEEERRKQAAQRAAQQRTSLPSSNSWRGVTPSQVAKTSNTTSTAPKTSNTTSTAPKVNTQAAQKSVQSAINSGASYRGVTPTQLSSNVSKQAVSLPVIRNNATSTAQKDNSLRARVARSHEKDRQAAAANAASIKQDKATLASNSLKWHQTSDAAEKRKLEAASAAIRARRGYSYDSRTGSTYDGKGNELSAAARQIYGGRAETAKQFRDVAQTKDFVRDTRSTASQPSILDVSRGVTANNSYYAFESGQKAHNIIANLLNRSDETWTDTDTKRRDEARDALQKEMQAVYKQYGATYQPRLSADEIVKDLRLRGADEQTLEYVRENLSLRDASDRLGQGLTAVGKRLEASIPSLIDTAKQAISNQSENKENDAFTQLEEQEKQLELQLQNMQSQDENGKVPADYQQVYDQLQRVREEKNSIKVEKGVDPNKWSQTVLREANEAQANAEAGLASAPRWLTEQAISLAGNAPTMAASAIPVVGPAISSVVMGAQAAGQRAFELNEQGKSAGEALGRGTVSGVIEAATEKLPLEKMAEILHSGGTNAVKNILRQMGTEATEESVSYFLNYVSDLAAADPDAKFSLAELARSAAGGAFGGLVFGTAGTIGAKFAQRNEGGTYDNAAYERDVVRSLQEADAQLRAAQSLPEGAARETAVNTAREKMARTISDFATQQAAENAERSASYDANLDEHMSLAQRARAAEYLNQRTGQADAWQEGQVKPRLGTEIEERPESTYRTPEEENALQSQLERYFEEERQTETGGARDRTAAESQTIGQQQQDSAETVGAEAVRENNSSANIPLSEVMQYGKTPEQAVMEAQARAEGEQVRQAREMSETDTMQNRLEEVWQELVDLDAHGKRRSDEFRELWDEKEQLKEQLAARGVRNGAVMPDISQPESTQSTQQTTMQRAPASDEMRLAGESAKRTAADYLDSIDAMRDKEGEQANRETYRELRAAWDEARSVEDKIEFVRKQVQLTDRDKRLLQAALASGHSEILADCENQPAALHLYELENRQRETLASVREYNNHARIEREMQAEQWAEKIAEHASDKARGLYYLTETPERNIYDIFGKEHRAEAEGFIREYLTPVHEAVAESTRLQNRLRGRIDELHLDRHDSTLVQMIGEGKKAAALEYAEKHGIKIDAEKEAQLNHAANVFRDTYDELFDMINDAEVRNGLKPTRKRENYFPHFTEKAPDTLVARAMWRLGMKITGRDTLPTDLAGQTEQFRPGHKWERHLQHREGEATIYDAVKGFDQYVADISDYIMLTDQIQKLRALEDSVRYTLSDEGVQTKIDEIKSDYMSDPLERRQAIEAAYDDGGNRTAFQRAIDPLREQQQAGMRNFVTELRRYTDSLCGKKHRGDRGIEDIVGRDVYEISKNVEGRVAANMIALNPGSWLTNFIPLTQAAGEIDARSLLQGMAETVRAAFSDDGFVNASTFLTNRYGSDSISKTAMRRVSDLAGAPMECIDHFTSESIVRARVAQNIRNHIDLNEAFAEADSFAASLMADYSKGAIPGAFEMKNPLVKVFTMYQLETNNQLRYFFKDLPRHMEGKSKARAVASTGFALTKAFTLAFAYNKIYHELTGRDSALDPIGMIVDAFGLGDDDDEKKEKSGVDIALDLGGNVAEQLPFIGGLLGGGRVPISAALPDFSKLIEEYQNGYDSKRLALDTGKQLATSAAYLGLPFGGGALKKAIEGAATINAGGSYSLDKNGEKILQFPTYGQSPLDYAKAMLFGKSSLKTAQDWAENDYDTLNADETKVFDTLRERMNWTRDENGNAVDNSEAVYAAIKAMKAITNEQGYGDVSANQIREMLFYDNDLTAGQKEYLDSELVSGGQSGSYSSETAFKVSQLVREARQSDAIEAAKHGISPEVFAEWDNRLQTELADNYVDAAYYDEDGNNKLYANNTVLSNLLSDYMGNPNLTDAEKQAFADYVIISAMSKKDETTWNEEVKGVVNASDYVKFKGDLAAYKKEFEGTGTDNAASVREILNSYTNLSDEQKSVLMNVYSDSIKNNLFHVSSYEQALADNSYYQSLNDSEKSKLRANCNEFEQAINEGKELDGWKAKAYMAKEAGIEPGTYALFQTALSLINSDGGTPKNAEITEAVKLVPGLTDSQRAYLWQAAYGKDTTKNNPWGGATVTKYQKSEDEAINPVEGGTISSPFGWRQSFTTSNGESSSSNHKAIDIAAPEGTAVKAAMSGTVVASVPGYNGGYGNTVEIDCGNGIVMKYHHMQDGSIDGIEVGQEISAGTQIGKVGSTGNTSGPHLDFQVVKDGNYVDPRNYIPGYGEGTSATISAAQAAVAASSGSGSSKSGKSSSGGSSGSSGLKNLSNPKGLPIFR